MSQSQLDYDQGIEIVDNLFDQLAMVRQMLIDIRDRAQKNQEKEAA